MTLGEALGSEGAKLGEKLPQGGDGQQELWQAEIFSWIKRKRRICWASGCIKWQRSGFPSPWELLTLFLLCPGLWVISLPIPLLLILAALSLQ